MAYNPKDKNPSGVVLFGNNGSDQVFESVTDFVYDTGNTRLGINTSSPQYTLDVSGTGTFHTIRFADGTEMITSGGGGGGTTYTAGSGLTLDGTEFNVFGGSGNFQYIELKSSTQDPQIYFLGSGSNDTPITLNILSSYQSASSSGSALVFDGTEGQLFAITDNLSSGVIFSVADIAGLPLIEADASGDVQLIEFGRYVGVGTGTPQYQLDVFGTGRFSSGIIFPDGNRQTIAYTGGAGGGMTSWDLSVTGDSVTITDGATVTFTGQGSITTTRNANTVIISGAAGGSDPTGTASGVAFFGDDNNLTESSKLVFTSGGRGELNIDNQTGIINVTEIETTGSAITLDYGTAQLVRFVEGNFSDPVMVSFRNNGFGFRDGNPSIFSSTTSAAVTWQGFWGPWTNGGVDHGSSSKRWQDYYGYRMDLDNDTASSIVLKVQGAASQSANLQEWQNSSATVLASIDPSGKLYYQSSYSPISDEGTASSFTFDLDTSNVFSGTLSAASTLATSNGDVGQRFLVRLKQGSGGSKTVSSWFNGRVSWPGGSAPTLSSTAGHVDLFGFLVTSGTAPTLYYDGFTIATGIQ